MFHWDVVVSCHPAALPRRSKQSLFQSFHAQCHCCIQSHTQVSFTTADKGMVGYQNCSLSLLQDLDDDEQEKCQFSMI